MKKLLLIGVASALASIIPAQAKTVLFNDTFGTSTLNGTSTPVGSSPATSTSYDVASTKNGTTCAIAPNDLLLKLAGGTTAGYIELQSLFASTPVQLVNVGDNINLTVTFTNTAGTLLSGGSGSVIDVGLYNSGGALPIAGGIINNTGLSGGTTNITGNCQDWQGYVGQINFSGAASSIYTRPAQDGTGANNGVQDLLFSGAGTGLYKFPAGTTIGSTSNSAVTLTTGGVYTRSFTVKLTGATEVTITDELYPGPVAVGIPLSSLVRTTTGGNTYTNYANLYDGFAIGVGNKGTSANPTMDIGQITITKATKADEPALYNLQLNGFTNSTFSGAAQIGKLGDVWNNPDWPGVYIGSTNIFTGVTIVDSTGATNGVTATMTSVFNNNTGDWNTGSFNHYTGQSAGSATPVLVDQVAKIDYNAGLGGINVITLSFSGLPTNTPVTAYVYGTGNSDGTGSKWSFAAGNGGGVATNVANTATVPTDRNVTLASSKGYGWNSITGTSDASGNLTVIADGNAGGSVWWQVYLNGIQLQVGGTAPVIFGLTNQSVEAGTTVLIKPVVSGNPAPSYQWLDNGAVISGETGGTLTLTNVDIGLNGHVYSLVASNPLGSVTNGMTLNVTIPVYSTMTATPVSPAKGAVGVCPDTALTVTFSDTVSLGTLGAIKIFDATNTATPVDTISAAAGLIQQRTFPGDNQSFSYQTVAINGHTVTIHPDFNVLTSNQTYYVTIDPKTFKDSGGVNFVGLTNATDWTFSTKSGPADTNNPVVSADGSADFLTVQGALNSIPAGSNATQRVIHVRNGFYNEIVDIAGKHNVTLQGESRNGAVIYFPNNATFQIANGGTTHARMTFKVNANDVVIDSLTISNSTPQGGSQAEALMIESSAKRCIIMNSELDSRQDTILANVNSSQAYFYHTLIKGNFDYIWGGGNLYFDQCEIRTIGGASGFNLTAARTDTGATQSASLPWANPGGTFTANGMSFVNCTFTADPGVGAVTLAGSNGTAGNNVSWYGCDFATNYVAPSASLFSGNFVFWQSQNTMTNSPVTFAVVTGLSGVDPRLQAATNLPTWFYGWTPVLPPMPATLSAAGLQGNGSLQFRAAGAQGQSYRAWASEDFMLRPVTNTWTLVGSGTFGAAPTIISDPDAPNHPHRYYLITVP
jgi:pectin methylesterase-like acyl-CoA thioesterase